jgi:hypothetical protein
MIEVEVTLQLTVSQYVKLSSPLWDLWPDITFCPKVVFWKLLSLSLWDAFSDRSGLSFVFISLVIYQYLHQNIYVTCVLQFSNLYTIYRDSRLSSTPDVTINDIQIPRNTEIKYLGVTIDSKLTWKQHIAKKRKQVNITIKQVNWLLGRKSNLAIENKLLIYKTIIIPIWT